ncbi:MAG TPA: tetratricopeptide repeat protein, partial [Bacteroidales bacterium]|nr:tetratricopeptide repeat protein [Bacteroidales bacterium]
MKKTLLAATMLISACIATAQDYHKIDSLKTILNTLPPLNGTDADTTRMQVCLDIGYLYEYYIPDSAIWWYSSITDTSFNAEKIKLFQKNAIINAEGLMYIGIVAYYLGYYSSAILYYERSLKIFEELGYKSGISSSLNNLGNVASLQGNYVAAQSYFERSLKVWEKIGDKSSISECLNNLGNVASEQGNYSAATLYYERSLKILEELGEITGISTCIQNLGCVALDQGNYSLAILYFNHSLKIFEELGNKSGISSCLNNLGVAAKNQGNYSAALSYYESSLKISEELGDKSGISKCLTNLGVVAMNQGNYAAAISCFERSLKICEEIGEKARLASNYPALAKAYIQMNMEEKALPLYLTSQEITISLLKDNFTILSEVEKSLYLDKTKDVFNNINEFNLHYGNQFDSLAGDCYNNELILKGLLLNSTGSMLNAVYNSQDTALKNTYFRLKQYRDEISALQGVPIEEREKDMESLEKLANDEERKLVKMSSQFDDMQKLYSFRWQDVQMAMKPGEAAVEFLEINHKIFRSDTCTNDSITYAALVLKPGDKYPIMVPLCSYDELSALFFSGSIESSSELLADRGMIFKDGVIDFA